jgi:hypothetical protein
MVNADQQRFIDLLVDHMGKHNMRPRTVGISDFGNADPLTAVCSLMGECSGAVVLGLRQTSVGQAIEKDGTKARRERGDYFLPTAWNHIEASVAYAMNLPILFLKEDGVEGGVFDLGTTKYFIRCLILHRSGLSPTNLDSPS